jgi:hypothetical protein
MGDILYHPGDVTRGELGHALENVITKRLKDAAVKLWRFPTHWVGNLPEMENDFYTVCRPDTPNCLSIRFLCNGYVMFTFENDFHRPLIFLINR